MGDNDTAPDFYEKQGKCSNQCLGTTDTFLDLENRHTITNILTLYSFIVYPRHLTIMLVITLFHLWVVFGIE